MTEEALTQLEIDMLRVYHDIASGKRKKVVVEDAEYKITGYQVTNITRLDVQTQP